MKQNRHRTSGGTISSVIAGAGTLMLAGALVAAYANPPTAQMGSDAGANQTAAQRYKNIQVLKDIPADELIPSMEFISASLGVECDFCHVAGPNHHLEFDKDDKKTKKTARAMMQMMFTINKNNFEGEREVTCNSCHRGSPHPQPVPAIMAEAKPEPAAEHADMMNSTTQPSGLPLLAKYIEALGGTAALEQVKTRIETGKALVPDGPAMTIMIYTKAPDQRVSVMHTPRGESVTAYNGQAGWLTFPGRPVRQMTPEDQLAAKLDAEAFYPRKLEAQFTDLKLQEMPEKIGDQECDVVLGTTKGEPPVKLYFDKSSGLLVRMVHYTNTALGLLPTQVDFADYREVGGVKTPYRWTIARPGGSFTIQLDKVEQNVPIDEARFAEPKPTAPIPGTQSPPPSGHGMPEGPKPPQESVPPGAAAPPSGAI